MEIKKWSEMTPEERAVLAKSSPGTTDENQQFVVIRPSWKRLVYSMEEWRKTEAKLANGEPVRPKVSGAEESA